MTDTATPPTQERLWVDPADAYDAALQAEHVAPPTRRVRRAERRVDRAKQKADRERAKLEARQELPERKAKGRRRLRRLLVVVVILANIAVAGYAYWYLQIRTEEPPVATVSIETTAELGQAVVVRSGSVDLLTLAGSLDPGLAVIDGSTIELRTSVFVTEGGQLTVSGGELRLLSSPATAIGIVVDGGSLSLEDARIVAWDGDAIDADPTQPRAYVDVTNSVVDIRGTEFVALGSGEGGHSGLTLGAGTGGAVQDSTFTDSYVGLELTGELDELTVDGVLATGTILAGIEVKSAANAVISGSSVTDSLGDGFAVTGSSERIDIVDSDAFDNASSGFQITGAAGDIRLIENRSFRNQRSGIAIANTRDVLLERNSVWSNLGGIFLTGANASTRLENNVVTGNRGTGVEVASAGTSVTLEQNGIDHNEIGVLVADGSVVMADNEIVENGVGIGVFDSSPSVVMTGNVVNENFDVGLRFLQPDGLEVTGNEFLGNEHAAFQVDLLGSSALYHETNKVEAGRYGVERVFSGYASAEELADITPVPDFFFIEPERSLAPGGS